MEANNQITTSHQTKSLALAAIALLCLLFVVGIFSLFVDPPNQKFCLGVALSFPGVFIAFWAFNRHRFFPERFFSIFLTAAVWATIWLIQAVLLASALAECFIS